MMMIMVMIMEQMAEHVMPKDNELVQYTSHIQYIYSIPECILPAGQFQSHQTV